LAREARRQPTAASAAPALRIDLARPVPPYEQLREQIAGLIAAGQLPPGSRLASVRQLAGDLGLAPGTVARAYSELEAAGAITTRRRGGTFVAAADSAAGRTAARQRALAEAADSYVAAVRGLGLSEDAAQAGVREAIARLGAIAH
jgi:DNA-binding transcriptional regulator YhcF (GntR family)